MKLITIDFYPPTHIILFYDFCLILSQSLHGLYANQHFVYIASVLKVSDEFWTHFVKLFVKLFFLLHAVLLSGHQLSGHLLLLFIWGILAVK